MSKDFISINIDHAEVERKVAVLKHIKGAAPRAIKEAMNRTLSGMRTDAAAQIAGGRNGVRRYTKITQGDVKAQLNLSRASVGDLSIEMGSKGRPIRLAKFKTKPNKCPGQRGAPTAFAQVKKSNSGARIRGAFMADFRAGKGVHTGIFVRTGKFAKVRSGANKGRIKEGIRLEQLFKITPQNALTKP